MAETGRKLVHWALNASTSGCGSPFYEASNSSFSSTPNLQYINSQLIAHGFTTAPGLSLDGISKTDSERVAKCLLTMLSQRVDDMSRAEDLSTKLRTLSYDHERLIGMHSASKEEAASAGREVNQYKSRLATATRALQSSEANRKQTAAELQRTRTSLQGIRAAHVTELRKKEKEIERMVEKWNKLVEAQSKVSAASSGISIYGANAEVVSGSDNIGKGKGYLDVALEHAESSRAELFAESTRLRRLIVTCANRIQSLTHKIRLVLSVEDEEPPSLNHDALFPLAPINAAEERLLSLFSAADSAFVMLSMQFSEMSGIGVNPSSTSSGTSGTTEGENLRVIIEKLRAELEETLLQCESQSAEIQALKGRVAQQATSLDSCHLDTELKLAPERERLEQIKKELEDERAKFTEAAIKLIKERTALENDRIEFLEEKRTWHQQSQAVSSGPPLIPNVVMPTEQSQKKSPRKSPRKKQVVAKSNSGRKVRTPWRSSAFSISSSAEPAYETEVIPICVSAQLSNEQAQPTTRQSILPTSFVLPPPSPRTSLPPPPNTLLGLSGDASSGNGMSTEDGLAEIALPSSSDPTSSSPILPLSTGESGPSDVQPNGGPTPQTPLASQHPFPVAKPLAPRMTHAYSPAKPSPLSRILMLGESPESAGSVPLPAIRETGLTPTNSLQPSPNYVEDDEDSPLREKRTKKNVNAKDQRADEAAKSLPKAKTHARTNALVDTGKTKTRGSLEKENRGKSSLKVPPATAPQGKAPSNSKAEPSSKGMSKTIPKLPTGRGGARRVPIGSTEAAPGWKG
ncbi:Afadin and alpha-actinin-binding-domain-containing protein [Pisolithus sp. B1]|nr:Afadin and alpha-actinin-binding-domain-containing protein [Pisolithus sp. B1]